MGAAAVLLVTLTFSVVVVRTAAVAWWPRQLVFPSVHRPRVRFPPRTRYGLVLSSTGGLSQSVPTLGCCAQSNCESSSVPSG
jgi:hypothetical protein